MSGVTCYKKVRNVFCLGLFYGKKHNYNLTAVGVSVGVKTIIKSILSVLLGVASLLLIVFFVDYLFDVNFLFIYWGFMKFLPNRIPGMLLVCPMYILFYIALSVSVNGFNFNNAIGKNRYIGVPV